MGLLDSKHNEIQTDELLTKPLELELPVKNAVNYLRKIGPKLVKWRPEKVQTEQTPPFEDLQTVIEAVDTLDDDLEANPNNTKLTYAIAPFACACAEQEYHGGAGLTHKTMKEVKYWSALPLYWLKGLLVQPENRAALSRQGGVYEIGVRIDKPSTTSGAEELQQSIAALSLHRADVMASTANTPLDVDFENPVIHERSSLVTRAKKYLQDVKNGTLKWNRQPHLAHIRSAVSKPKYYSHDSSLIIKNGKPDRRISHIDEEKVRIFRSSLDHKSGYYLDINTEDFKTLNPKVLEQLLIPSDSSDIPQGELLTNLTWHHFTSGDSLWNKENEPPAFSVSSNIYESGNKVLQDAATSGNSITHVAYDWNKIILQNSHVAENGASLKFGALGVAHAVQIERKPGESLVKSTMPRTEIRNPFNVAALPSKAKLQLTRYSESTLQELITSFGLSDVRMRFDDLSPEDTANLQKVANELNAKYTAPRIAQVQEFISSNQADFPLDEESQKEFIKLVAPELTIQSIMLIAQAEFLGKAAYNVLPLKITNELAHTSVPIIPLKEDGYPDIDDPEWISRFRTETILGKFALNIYNVYKNLTETWRLKKGIGAEALAKIFSKYLGEYMKPPIHYSDLGPYIGKVEGVAVELDFFDTASPDPNEKYTNAFATFTQKTPEGFVMKPSFRDKLLLSTVDAFQINNSGSFNEIFESVASDVTSTENEQDKREIRTLSEILFKRWIEITEENPTLDSSQVLVNITLEYYNQLANSTNTNWRKAFQILLVSGMRRDRQMLLDYAKSMKI